VAVRIHLCWPEEGEWISPMKSRPHYWNGFSVEMGFRGKGKVFFYPKIFGIYDKR